MICHSKQKGKQEKSSFSKRPKGPGVIVVIAFFCVVVVMLSDGVNGAGAHQHHRSNRGEASDPGVVDPFPSHDGGGVAEDGGPRPEAEAGTKSEGGGVGVPRQEHPSSMDAGREPPPRHSQQKDRQDDAAPLPPGDPPPREPEHYPPRQSSYSDRRDDAAAPPSQPSRGRDEAYERRPPRGGYDDEDIYYQRQRHRERRREYDDDPLPPREVYRDRRGNERDAYNADDLDYSRRQVGESPHQERSNSQRHPEDPPRMGSRHPREFDDAYSSSAERRNPPRDARGAPPPSPPPSPPSDRRNSVDDEYIMRSKEGNRQQNYKDDRQDRRDQPNDIPPTRVRQDEYNDRRDNRGVREHLTFDVEDNIAAHGGPDMGIGAPPRAPPPHSHPGSERPSSQTKDEGLIQEWELQMQNFVPEMLVTFPLAGRSDEYFYEEVGETPVQIRGGYFVSSDEDQSDVEFQITDPSGDVVYHRKTSEGLFYFTTTLSGIYSFIISNHRWLESKMVTFAVGLGNDTALQPQHLNPIEEHVTKIDRQLRDIQAESTYLWTRERSHFRAIDKTKNRILYFSILEFCVLVGVAATQVHFIKGLLSDRRLL